MTITSKNFIPSCRVPSGMTSPVIHCEGKIYRIDPNWAATLSDVFRRDPRASVDVTVKGGEVVGFSAVDRLKHCGDGCPGCAICLADGRDGVVDEAVERIKASGHAFGGGSRASTALPMSEQDEMILGGSARGGMARGLMPRHESPHDSRSKSVTLSASTAPAWSHTTLIGDFYNVYHFPLHNDAKRHKGWSMDWLHALTSTELVNLSNSLFKDVKSLREHQVELQRGIDGRDDANKILQDELRQVRSLREAALRRNAGVREQLKRACGWVTVWQVVAIILAGAALVEGFNLYMTRR